MHPVTPEKGFHSTKYKANFSALYHLLRFLTSFPYTVLLTREALALETTPRNFSLERAQSNSQCMQSVPNVSYAQARRLYLKNVITA